MLNSNEGLKAKLMRYI